MPLLQRLLQRWGFVKLGSYGLELTPDGKISSNRPVILDDGTGARIVGWQDGDPAISELAPWPVSEPSRAKAAAVAQPQAAGVAQPQVARTEQAARPGPSGPRTNDAQLAAAPVKETARAEPAASSPVAPKPSDPCSPVMASAADAVMAPAASVVMAPAASVVMAPAASSLIPASSVSAAAAAESSAADMADEMALGAPVDEDDWEWTIALAKARAAAELPETAAATGPAPIQAATAHLPSVIVELHAPVASRVTAATRVAAQRVTKIPTVPAEDIAAMASAAPLAASAPAARSSSAPSAVSKAPQATVARAPQPATASSATQTPPQRGGTPATVIPVPPLPTIETAHGRLAPVVRTTPPRSGPRVPPASMARFAKGTGPVDPDSTSEAPAPVLVEPAPSKPAPKSKAELPLAARVVALPNLRARVIRR